MPLRAISVALLWGMAASASPAGLIEQRIAEAREAIGANKAIPNAYNDLAIALARRARETADSKYCAEAGRAVAESLKLAPGNFEGRKARVIVRLCQKRWDDALEEAAALNKKVPDDVMLWGYIADANVALGNYPAAEKAAQWMLDLRRVNPQGLARGAVLRELFGYNNPALEWWNSALRLTSANDVEERAWLLTRIARLDRMIERPEAADAVTKQALDSFPDYPWALEESARNQLRRKKYAEAVETLRRRLKIAPSVSLLLDLGLALEGAGETVQAQRTFFDFEKQARELIEAPDNANLELIRYYSGPAKNSAEAVRIAQLTLRRRQDVYAVEAYAQALAMQGDYKSAAAQMAVALKPGVKIPAWLLDAGKIAQSAGDSDAAHKYFQQALESAPSSPLANEIIQALQR